MMLKTLTIVLNLLFEALMLVYVFSDRPPGGKTMLCVVAGLVALNLVFSLAVKDGKKPDKASCVVWRGFRYLVISGNALFFLLSLLLMSRHAMTAAMMGALFLANLAFAWRTQIVQTLPAASIQLQELRRKAQVRREGEESVLARERGEQIVARAARMERNAARCKDYGAVCFVLALLATFKAATAQDMAAFMTLTAAASALVGAGFLVGWFLLSRNAQRTRMRGSLALFGLDDAAIDDIENNSTEGDTLNMRIHAVYWEYYKRHAQAIDALEKAYDAVMTQKYGFRPEFARDLRTVKLGAYSCSDAILWHRYEFSAHAVAAERYKTYSKPETCNNAKIFAVNIATGERLETRQERSRLAYWLWADGKATPRGVALVTFVFFIMVPLTLYLKFGIRGAFVPSDALSSASLAVSAALGVGVFFLLLQSYRGKFKSVKKPGLFTLIAGGPFTALIFWMLFTQSIGHILNSMMGEEGRRIYQMTRHYGRDGEKCLKPVVDKFAVGNRFCPMTEHYEELEAAKSVDAVTLESWFGQEIIGYYTPEGQKIMLKQPPEKDYGK